MTVHLRDKGVSFFSVPKCLSTSTKEMIFEYENGRSIDSIVVNGKPLKMASVHYFYPTASFLRTSMGAAKWKSAIIRNPISRLLSAYGNRVLVGKGILETELTDDDRKMGLSRTPDLSNFVHFFREYRRVSGTVRHHLSPLNWCLGKEAGYFDRLYDISEVDTFKSDLTERLGELPELPHRMSEGKKFKTSDLTRKERKEIENVFAADYRIFGKHFN